MYLSFNRYAGIYNRQQCLCATVIGAQSNETCSLSCEGNDAQLCGGPQSISAYETGIMGLNLYNFFLDIVYNCLTAIS